MTPSSFFRRSLGDERMSKVYVKTVFNKLLLPFIANKEIYEPGVYEYDHAHPNGFVRWLQELCFNFLARTKGLKPYCRVEPQRMFKTITIDLGKAHNVLAEQLRDQIVRIDQLYGKKSMCVVAGREVMRTLCYDMEEPMGMTVRMEAYVKSEVRLFNLPVIFVPWFEGVLVVPDVPIEQVRGDRFSYAAVDSSPFFK